MEKLLTMAATDPFLRDVDGYAWEKIVAEYVGGKVQENKRLFDVVSRNTGTGWSCKTLQWEYSDKCEIECVIQRSDIIKKENAKRL